MTRRHARAAISAIVAVCCAGVALGLVWGLYVALKTSPDKQFPSGPEVPAASMACSVPNQPVETHATRGAAAGYVADRLCAECHEEIYESYQEVGMARSFYRPRAERAIEDFDHNRYYHEPSKRYFEMSRDGDRYHFKRYQVDDKGQPINVFEQDVDWIMGSGNHARSYLYRTAAGELFQLPIGWYTQEKQWAMSPGFDRPDHEGLGRIVRRECMFCHNAYPDVPKGSDVYGAAQIFPATLPEGIGCQRCHGPGETHVRTQGDPQEIVNPGRLSGQLRDDVCNACHLQPSVAMFGVRRFGRADYSQRPGQPLDDYYVQMDIVDARQERSERFEINHHPYRLMQSRCFLKSDGKLNCLSCHDPHRHVPADKRVAHYRQACLQCHHDEDCKRDEAARHQPLEAVDCAACHMPRRRTQDVVHVVMTDHLIQRSTGDRDLLAPLAETEPDIDNVELVAGDQPLPKQLGDVYRAIAVLRATGDQHRPALAKLEQLLAKNPLPDLEPYLDLGRSQIRLGRFADAQRSAEFILQRHPGHPLAMQWLGVSLIAQGQNDAAIAHLQRLVLQFPDDAETHYNFGLVLVAEHRQDDALAELKRAVALRPNLTQAWYYLGNVHSQAGRLDDAIACYRRSLETDPTFTRAYVGIGKALLADGQRDEALRYLRHGVAVARQPELVRQALQEAS